MCCCSMQVTLFPSQVIHSVFVFEFLIEIVKSVRERENGVRVPPVESESEVKRCCATVRHIHPCPSNACVDLLCWWSRKSNASSPSSRRGWTSVARTPMCPRWLSSRLSRMASETDPKSLFLYLSLSISLSLLSLSAISVLFFL